MSMPLSLCCLHIKLHLTSISVKETGASGSCPITTQHLLPPSLPPLSCHTTHLLLPTEPIFRSPTFCRPFSSSLLLPLSDKTSHFCRRMLHLGSWVNLWLNGSPLTPFLWICSVSQALIYALLKRLHTIERINTKCFRKGEVITNIWRVFKGALNKILILPLNQITPLLWKGC